MIYSNAPSVLPRRFQQSSPMPSIVIFLWCGNQNDWCGHKPRPNHAHPLCLKFFFWGEPWFLLLYLRVPVWSMICGSYPHHGIGVCLAGSSTTHDPSTTSWTPAARTLLVWGIRGSPSTCHLVKIFVHHLHEKWCNHQNIHRNSIDHIWQNVPIC